MFVDIYYVITGTISFSLKSLTLLQLEYLEIMFSCVKGGHSGSGIFLS